MIRSPFLTRLLILFLAGPFHGLAGPSLRSQEHQGNPPLPDPKVVEAFKRWEEAYRKIQKMECQIVIHEYDKLFETNEKRTETLKIIKTKNANKNTENIMIFYKNQNLYVEKTNNDTTLTFCQPELKTKYSKSLKNLSLSIKNINKDNISLFESFSISMDYYTEFSLSLFFDQEIFLNKYSIKFNKEDDRDYYFDISPLNKKDPYAMKNIHLVLSKSNGLPKKLWRKEENGNEVHFDIKSINLDPILELKDVFPPETDKTRSPKLINLL